MSVEICSKDKDKHRIVIPSTSVKIPLVVKEKKLVLSVLISSLSVINELFVLGERRRRRRRGGGQEDEEAVELRPNLS